MIKLIYHIQSTLSLQLLGSVQSDLLGLLAVADRTHRASFLQEEALRADSASELEIVLGGFRGGYRRLWVYDVKLVLLVRPGHYQRVVCNKTYGYMVWNFVRLAASR